MYAYMCVCMRVCVSNRYTYTHAQDLLRVNVLRYILYVCIHTHIHTHMCVCVCVDTLYAYIYKDTTGRTFQNACPRTLIR